MPSLRWPSALGPKPDRMRPLTGQMNLPEPAALIWAAVVGPRSMEGAVGALGGGALGGGAARAIVTGAVGVGAGGGGGGLVRMISDGGAEGGLAGGVRSGA